MSEHPGALPPDTNTEGMPDVLKLARPTGDGLTVERRYIAEDAFLARLGDCADVFFPELGETLREFVAREFSSPVPSGEHELSTVEENNSTTTTSPGEVPS